MQKEEVQGLVYKYLNDTASPEEREQLLNWYRKAVPGEEVEWLATEKDEEELLKASMFEYIKNQTGIVTLSKSSRKLWPRIAMAAAAVAAIVFGVWFYAGSPIVNRKTEIVAQNDVKPGKNTATLTLANGKTISLSDAKTGVIIDADALTYNDGSAVGVHSLPPQRDLTITTPRGGQYQVTLPDGTKVWLNAASSLTYSAPLNERGGQRKVELSGEAYFEVFRNKKQPFVVKSKKMDLTVLGTHFNISAYPDDGSTKTTLLEGSVKVSTPPVVDRKSEIVILLPNQQAVLTANGNLAVKQADINEVIAWKEGYFRFNDENITSIMAKLARWYNIAVVFEAKPSTEGFNGKISRFKNISQVLKMLEETNAVRFKVEGQKVTVMK